MRVAGLVLPWCCGDLNTQGTHAPAARCASEKGTGHYFTGGLRHRSTEAQEMRLAHSDLRKQVCAVPLNWLDLRANSLGGCGQRDSLAGPATPRARGFAGVRRANAERGARGVGRRLAGLSSGKSAAATRSRGRGNGRRRTRQQHLRGGQIQSGVPSHR